MFEESKIKQNYTYSARRRNQTLRNLQDTHSDSPVAGRAAAGMAAEGDRAAGILKTNHMFDTE